MENKAIKTYYGEKCLHTLLSIRNRNHLIFEPAENNDVSSCCSNTHGHINKGLRFQIKKYFGKNMFDFFMIRLNSMIKIKIIHCNVNISIRSCTQSNDQIWKHAIITLIRTPNLTF